MLCFIIYGRSHTEPDNIATIIAIVVLWWLSLITFYINNLVVVLHGNSKNDRKLKKALKMVFPTVFVLASIYVSFLISTADYNFK